MARPLPADVTLGELADRFGGGVAPAARALRIRRLATLASAADGDLSFLSSARYRDDASRTRATAVVVARESADALPAGVAPLVVQDPYAHFATIARWFAGQLEPRPMPGVHPTATVHASAELGQGVHLGAFCVVEAGARIGDGAIVEAHCHVGPGASIGPGTRLHPNVVVYHDCRIGARGLVHAGTVIGADGFGFAREQGRWSKIPQLGAVVIGDDVEIGANCSIDRGALDDTVIGDGCKLDNLIQIGHNVVIGEHSALAGCVGVAGSARIGRRCMIGGSAGILGHLEICDDVVVSAMTLVTRSIRKPGFYSGVFPLMDNAEWEKAAATLRRLPQLRGRLRRLERAAGPNATEHRSDSED